MLFGIHPLGWVFINSFVAFIYLFIISKILGKKQIAQLEFIDYTVGISLGSIAAEMSFDSDTPFYYYLIAMTIFFLLALLVAIVGRKTTFFNRRHRQRGRPARFTEQRSHRRRSRFQVGLERTRQRRQMAVRAA